MLFIYNTLYILLHIFKSMLHMFAELLVVFHKTELFSLRKISLIYCIDVVLEATF